MLKNESQTLVSTIRPAIYARSPRDKSKRRF
jgi:hypothetical protein